MSSKPCTYEYWRSLLLKKGFETPYYTKGFWSFKREDTEVRVGYHSLKNGLFPVFSVYYKDVLKSTIATPSEWKNILRIIDAIVHPKKFILCLDITWSAPYLETVLKNG